MTNRFNRAVLLLAALTTSALTTGCKDDDQATKTHNLNDYMVSTYSLFQTYYKPKKANIFAQGKTIGVDWYGNENAAFRRTMDRYLIDDYEQVNAEHYFFFELDVAQKYVDDQMYNPGRVIADEKEIISPYKEYAEYYADTTHLTDHRGWDHDGTGIFDGCVLPLIAIDVACNKDFDKEHPTGTKLNDILFYDQAYESYLFLQDTTNNGKPISSIPNFNPRKLSELPNNPVYLMESNFEILFDHGPTTPGTYEFTVKFTFGPDPLTGETVDIAPAKVSIEF